jgi:hypothetical protein
MQIVNLCKVYHATRAISLGDRKRGSLQEFKSRSGRDGEGCGIEWRSESWTLECLSRETA